MKYKYTPEDWDNLRKKIEETGLASHGITSSDIFYYCRLASQTKDPLKYYQTKVIDSSKKRAEDVFSGKTIFLIVGKDSEKIKKRFSTFDPKQHMIMLAKLRKIQENDEFIDYLKKEDFLETKNE